MHGSTGGQMGGIGGGHGTGGGHVIGGQIIGGGHGGGNGAQTIQTHPQVASAYFVMSAMLNTI